VDLSSFSRLVGLRHAADERRIVKSAMTPLLWVCTIGTPSCLAAAFAFKDNPVISYLLVGVGILPILAALAAYGYFALREPDRLHSEDYRLRHQALQIAERKGGKIALSEIGLHDILNPFPHREALEHKAAAGGGQTPPAAGGAGGV
jgi:hypothetical protein